MIPTAQNVHTNTQQWLLNQKKKKKKKKKKKSWGLEIAKENCLLGGGEKTKKQNLEVGTYVKLFAGNCPKERERTRLG
jgi:hypothetical protein